MRVEQRVVDRFFAKTTLDHDEWFDGSQCLLWTASHGTKTGAGRFSDGERFWVAHQFAYALQHGSIPDGHVVWHRCPNKLCVNHLHLEAIPVAESIRRSHLMYKPSPTYRCCGALKTPENSYGYDTHWMRCKACLKKAQAKWRKKPAVRKQIRARQRKWRANRKIQGSAPRVDL